MNELRSATGLEREEAELGRLLQGRGRRNSSAGDSFENAVFALAQHRIVPDLLEANPGCNADNVRVLRQVKLGAARLELDAVVVRLPDSADASVEVLALIEAKRNINDLAHGFRHRQENLAWLTGDAAGYDAAEYRTGYFTSGRFDRAAAHLEGNQTFRFSPASFARFRRDPGSGHFLDGLHLATRAGDIWGLPSLALARIAARVASDDRWNPDDDACMRELANWCRSQASAFETPEVLPLFVGPSGSEGAIWLAESG